MAENVQNKWMRYLSFGLVILLGTAYLYSLTLGKTRRLSPKPNANVTVRNVSAFMAGHTIHHVMLVTVQCDPEYKT